MVEIAALRIGPEVSAQIALKCHLLPLAVETKVSHTMYSRMERESHLGGFRVLPARPFWKGLGAPRIDCAASVGGPFE